MLEENRHSGSPVFLEEQIVKIGYSCGFNLPISARFKHSDFQPVLMISCLPFAAL